MYYASDVSARKAAADHGKVLDKALWDYSRFASAGRTEDAMLAAGIALNEAGTLLLALHDLGIVPETPKAS